MSTTELPFSAGMEKSVLSSMLKSPAMIARAAAEKIGEGHFHLPAHRTLFAEIRRRHDAGEEIELVTLVEDLHRTGKLEHLGGPAGLTEIYTYAPNDHHFAAHCARLRNDFGRRTAITRAAAIVENAAGMEPDELTNALSFALEGTCNALSADARVMTAKQATERLAARLLAMKDCDAHIPGLATSLHPVDFATGGLRPGELWVVAADTSGGKSVMMLQAVASALRENRRCLVISLEMEAEDIAARLIANLRSVPFDTFTRPKTASQECLERARRGLEELAAMPLSIDDRGGRTLEQITGLVQAEVDLHGDLALVVVDYLQLVEGTRRRTETREQEVAAISRGLKAMAKRFKLPVFTASQLNDNGRLRESRAIGQDADVVLVVENDGIRGLKIRNGVRDQVYPLALNGEFQRFEPIRPSKK